MTPQTQNKIVEFIQVTAPIVEAHLKTAAEKQAQEAKIKELIPQAVDALVESQRLKDHEREKAASALQDHVRTLEILVRTAKNRSPEELSHLGHADTDKQADSQSNAPFYGGRPRIKDRPSDIEWFKRMGVNVG